MMVPKRSHTTTHDSTPRERKRPKRKSRTTITPASSPQAESSTSDSDKLWPARRIVEEKKEKRRLLYLIDWEGINPKTGKDYERSWQPRANVLPDLIKAWEAEKKRLKQAQKAQQTPTPQAAVNGKFANPSVAQIHQKSPSQTVQRQYRKRKHPLTVIPDSSSQASQPGLTSPSPAEPRQPESPSTHAARPTSVSVTGTDTSLLSSLSPSPIFEPCSPHNIEYEDVEALHDSPEVHVTQKSNFDPSEYPRFSQVHNSSSLPIESAISKTPQIVKFGPNAVIPDSQSGTAESSIDTTILEPARPFGSVEFTKDCPTGTAHEVSRLSTHQPGKMIFPITREGLAYLRLTKA